jgi:hypothetical protein
MVIKQIEVSRTFNCGNYESERISLTAEILLSDPLDTVYTDLHDSIIELHREGPFRGIALRRK